MRRTGARLNLSGAMSRQSHLEPLDVQDTKSSGQSKAEREIKHLKLENQKLRTELTETRSLYKQLIKENSHEKFDERRVTVLKSQIIQLERQLLLFSEALTSRSETLYEVENNLQWLADKLRSFISKDVAGPRVPVERSDLTLMVETSESARIKLYKQIENHTKETLTRPLKFYSEFLQTEKHKDVTLLEVALGQLEHLNLRHVAKLETKLSVLYKELIQIHATMEAETSNESAYLWTSCHVTSAVRERLMTQVLKSCALLKDCSFDLLDLSLLFPSAPWPLLKRCALKEITAERVLGCMPSKLCSKSDDINKLIQALIKAYNYKIYMLQNQSKCLREEVRYHQKVYNLQLKYTESLLQAIREAYTAFEVSCNELIATPLNVVLEAYLELSQSASEVSLKKFIQTFKEQVPHLSNIVETVRVKEQEKSEGSKVLSQFGEEFFGSLETLVRGEQLKRDQEATKIDEIKCEQAKLDQELRDILQEQENRMQDTGMTSLMTSSETQFEMYTKNVEIGDFGRKNGSDEISDISARRKGSSVEKDTNESFKQILRTSIKSSKGRAVHKKEWVDVNDNESSKEILQPLVDNIVNEEEQNLPQRKDWVTLDSSIDNEISQLHLEDTEKNLSDMSDAELFSYHSKTGQQMVSVVKSRCEDSGTRALKTSSAKDSSSGSQKQGTKKKLNYVPNTFVPNRTLQLRRSGSVGRLVNKEEDADGIQDATVPVEVASRNSTQHLMNVNTIRNKNIPNNRPSFR